MSSQIAWLAGVNEIACTSLFRLRLVLALLSFLVLVLSLLLALVLLGLFSLLLAFVLLLLGVLALLLLFLLGPLLALGDSRHEEAGDGLLAFDDLVHVGGDAGGVAAAGRGGRDLEQVLGRVLEVGEHLGGGVQLL